MMDKKPLLKEWKQALLMTIALLLHTEIIAKLLPEEILLIESLLKWYKKEQDHQVVREVLCITIILRTISMVVMVL